MSRAKRIIATFCLLFAGLVGAGFLLPSSWSLERSQVIHAAPEKIYPLVADFKNGWPKWSVFDHEDPNIRYTYEGPEFGLGARRNWTSKKMGPGWQKIVLADSEKGIEFELHMEESAMMLHGRLTFTPDTTGTKVTWKDWGEMGPNPMHRYLGLLLPVMMGPAFEKSLKNLREIIEAAQ